MSPSQPTNRPSIALVQRSIAHYRVPLFEKLHRLSSYQWTFYCDAHPGAAYSGVPVESFGDLPVHPIRNRKIAGKLTWQQGVPIDRKIHQAIFLDLGWSILSNPVNLRRARRNGIGTVGWSKGISQNREYPKSGFRLAAERWIAKQCDALVVYGELSREYFLSLGYPGNRIFIAQNTTDTARIIRERESAFSQAAELRQRLRISTRPVVGFLGKIAAFKKVNCIIEAWEESRRSGVDSVLVIAGKGPERGKIETQIASSPFSVDIRYEPDVPPGAEGGFFQLFDVYASFAQGGLGILEAMAHKRAVLSTPEQFPETELLVDRKTAFISSEFTVDSFARRMSDAARDHEQRASTASRAEECVATRATQEQMVSAFDAAITCALGSIQP